MPLKDRSDDNIKFAMDWHITSVEQFDDIAVAIKWLNKAHDDLRAAFESAFTKKCLNIFEPEGNK